MGVYDGEARITNSIFAGNLRGVLAEPISNNQNAKVEIMDSCLEGRESLFTMNSQIVLIGQVKITEFCVFDRKATFRENCRSFNVDVVAPSSFGTITMWIYTAIFLLSAIVTIVVLFNFIY